MRDPQRELEHLRRRLRPYFTGEPDAATSGLSGSEGAGWKRASEMEERATLRPYLSELDQKLERRGHRYGRWADDFVILLRSERAAGRVMESVTIFLEETLGLPVNRDKSQVARVQDVEFLGFQILRKKIRISPKAQKRFKDRMRQLTRRNNGRSMAQNIQDLSEYLRGWVGYFRIQEFRQIFKKLDGFIRSRLRSMQLKKWKKPKKFQRMMTTDQEVATRVCDQPQAGGTVDAADGFESHLSLPSDQPAKRRAQDLSLCVKCPRWAIQPVCETRISAREPPGTWEGSMRESSVAMHPPWRIASARR